MSDFENAGEIETTAGRRIKVSDVAENGVSIAVPVTAQAGTPIGVATPASIGALNIDTASGALYVAIGLTNADWIAVGGSLAGVAPDTSGVVQSDDGAALLVLAPDTGKVHISDISEWNNDGQGIEWVPGQGMFVYTGNTGEFYLWQDNAGTLNAGAGGIVFPSADPHVAGAWWDNTGTLTRSSG